MTKTEKELQHKLKEYPLVKYNMLKHPVFHDLLSKASEEQLEYMNDFFDDEVEIIFSDSRSGTGKTFISVACCYADFLNTGKGMHFVISPVSEDIGALPGTKIRKEEPFFIGLYDALTELGMVPEQVIYQLVGENENIKDNSFDNCWVTATSHVHMRGSNVSKNLVLEETQNFKRNEIKKVLTRVKEGSTVCVVGSSIQIDLKNESKSGFVPYLEYFRNYDKFKEHTLTYNYRSRLSNFADDFTW